MGLDVYLYHCEDREQAAAAEKRAEDAANVVWLSLGKPYDELTSEERDHLRALALAERIKENCDEYGQHNSVTKIELNSQKYPDHYFKIGYFRSSYNAGGINSVMNRLGFPSLYEIMGVSDNSAYEVRHDWAQCLASVNSAIQRYQAHIQGPLGRFTVMAQQLRHHADRADSAQAALKIFAQEIERHQFKKAGFTSYGTSRGDFYLDGVRVHAFIPSSDEFTSMYAIVSKEDDGEEDWYLSALNIVRETCEYVLAQKDPQNYYMHWSS